MSRYTIVIFVAVILSMSVYAQENDTITVDKDVKSRWEKLMTWNFMALPYFNYSPETSWNFGGSGVYYFKMPKTKQYSDLTFNGNYSYYNQWFININSRLFFEGKKTWLIDIKLKMEHYPDMFYGVGSSFDDILQSPILITDNYYYASVHPQFYVSDRWLLGAHISYRYSNTTTYSSLDSLEQYSSIDGFGKMSALCLGVSASYDSRSNIYYPLKGLFFKTMITYYEPYLSSTYRMAFVDTDFRAYIPLHKELILAMQLKTQWALGNSKPYQLLPTLGGQDILRGVRENIWKDDALIAAQAELRVPIWNFLKAAAFVSVGDVYNMDNWKWNVPKIGYGVGLRACIHDIKMNVRFDVARQNYGDNWSFYFTVKEAF